MQTNLSEKITGYISDEDDIPHASETLEKCDVNLPTTSLPIFTLVADYESESDDGKYAFVEMMTLIFVDIFF